MLLHKLNVTLKGGKGSGDFGHTGRPGRRGGSGGGGRKGKKLFATIPTKNKKVEVLGLGFRPGFLKIRDEEGNIDDKVHKSLVFVKGSSGKLSNISEAMIPKKQKPNGSVETAEEIARQDKPKKKLTFGRSKPTNLDVDKNATRLNNYIDKSPAKSSSFNSKTVTNVSKLSGVDEKTVRNYISGWNGNNAAKRYIVSKTAHDELGTKLSPYEKKNEKRLLKTADALGLLDPEVQDKYRKITRAVYEDTQKQFKAAGVTEVVLFRGLDVDEPQISGGDTIRWHGNSLESWTIDDQVAKGFGRLTVKASIPANRIFSLSPIGPGTSEEKEIVVIGNGPNDRLTVVENVTEL